MSETSLTGYAAGNSERLTAANYNEVDALLFAKLSYSRFEDVYPNGGYNGRTVTVTEYAQALLDADMAGDDKALLEALAHSDRYAECTISQMQSSEGMNSQWAAMTVNINDGSNTGIVAMRGTDGTALGWNEDLELLVNGQGTNAQELSRKYLENCNAEHILATGHSKGGNDVVSAYAMADEATRKKVIHLDNFDGPGVNEAFREKYKAGYEELAQKLANYYPQDSIVGLLLNNNPGENHFIYSKASDSSYNMGIMSEHDAAAWQVDGTSFYRADQSWLSKLIDKGLDTVVENLPESERIKLYNVLIKFQIPELISGEHALYEMDEEEAAAWLEEQVRNGKISQEDADRYREHASKLRAFFLLYSTLTPEEKQMVNAIAAAAITVVISAPLRETIITAAAILAVQQYLNEKIAEMNRLFNEWAKRAAEKAKELAENIRSFAEDVGKRITSCWEKAKEFIFNRGRSGRTGTAGGPANFLADTDAMQMLAEEWQAQYRALQACAQQVQSIANSVCWSTSVAYGWQIGRLADNVRGEARNCSRMADGLARTAALYQRTERKITAEAGL